MSQSLILIQGAPGVGKTTLSTKLARDLALPLVTKDVLKEMLYDEVIPNAPELDSVAHSKRVGILAIKIAYDLVGNILDGGQSCVFENAFLTNYARDDVRSMLRAHPDVQCLELHCTLEESERQQRMQARTESGNRHAVHAGTDLTVDPKNYELLNVGQTITVNMLKFQDAEYQELLSEVRNFIEAQEA